MLVFENETDCHPQNAHDRDVVNGHADILGIIESRNLDLPGLPSQEGAK